MFPRWTRCLPAAPGPGCDKSGTAKAAAGARLAPEMARPARGQQMMRAGNLTLGDLIAVRFTAKPIINVCHLVRDIRFKDGTLERATSRFGSIQVRF